MPTSHARPSALDRVLRIVSDVRPGEAVTAVLLALNVFLYLSATQIAKVLREPLILAGGGTSMTGAQLKSYTNTAAALLLLIVVPLYGRLAGRVPRRRLMNIVTPAFVLCFAVFFVLARLGLPVGIPFYAFLAVFNVMILAQFWSFANDVYTEEAGKRLFPVVGIGGSAGAVAGSLLAGGLIAPLGLNGLFVVVAVVLVLAAGLTNVIDTRELKREEAVIPDGMTSGLLPAATAQYRNATGEFRTVGDEYREASGLHTVVRREQPPPEPETASTTGAFQLVRQNPYLLLIALLVVLLNWVNTNGEFILGDTVTRLAQSVAEGDPRDEYIGSFYAAYYAGTNTAVLILQTFLVSRIIKYLGVRGALLVLPVIVLGAYALLAFVPVLAAIRWAKTIENSTDYSLNNTVRHTLFLPTTREEKYKAKQVTDSFAQRAGDVLSALTVFVGSGLLALGASPIAILNIGLVVVWLVIAARIGRRYDRLAAATRL
jgi:AAA family ATP:ADP antiporter